MNRDQATALRAPFPAEKIGKVPRVTCGACRDSKSRNCEKHVKAKCGECGGYLTPMHIHLDYIGHADVTDRFLEVDPDWNWEPFALDNRGLPALDESGGMWIRLTILGVARIGYGDASGKKGTDAVKEIIGDALRNAGMRFGVGLDLWRKDLPTDDGPRRRQPEKSTETPTTEQAANHASLLERAKEAKSQQALRVVFDMVVEAFKAGELTAGQANGLRKLVGQMGERKAEMNDKTRARLFVLFGELDYAGDVNRQNRRDVATKVLNRTVESMKTLTEEEAQQVIAALEKRRAEVKT